MSNPFADVVSVEVVGHHPYVEENGVRRFELHRNNDVSGISGTGIVADGVVWEDGSATIRWRGSRPSIVHWQDVAHAESVHGHGGFTEFVFLDV